jgi:hypothetical protein
MISFSHRYNVTIFTILLLFIISTHGGDFKLRSNFETSKCNIKRKYVSSPIEQDWYQNIDSIAEASMYWEKGCAKMREGGWAVDKWLLFWQQRENFATRLRNAAKATDHPPTLKLSKVPRNFSKKVFSYMEYKQICDNKEKEVMQIPIEPLVGFLRHPLHHCFPKNFGLHSNYRVNKDYMIQPFSPEIYPTGGSDRRNYFFDLGASFYTSGLGGASQQWFFETYRSRGITFDRILAWVC